jgi:D-beta-D-heptose 7-phosphate kinase / D-beta-D-heptose 1-phosphate adenosyltransferase
LLRRVQPDVLVKGGTYAAEEVVGREVVQGYGGRVCVTGRRDGVSTTQLLAALRRAPAPTGT